MKEGDAWDGCAVYTTCAGQECVMRETGRHLTMLLVFKFLHDQVAQDQVTYSQTALKKMLNIPDLA